MNQRSVGPASSSFPGWKALRPQEPVASSAYSPVSEAFIHPGGLCRDRSASWWGRTWGRGGQPLGRVPPLPSPIFPSTGEVTTAPCMEKYGCSLLHDPPGPDSHYSLSLGRLEHSLPQNTGCSFPTSSLSFSCCGAGARDQGQASSKEKSQWIESPRPCPDSQAHSPCGSWSQNPPPQAHRLWGWSWMPMSLRERLLLFP